jgi:hypothetical protein
MPKPKGTCGATKMKILAIISHNEESREESYGYSIWQCLKDNFYTYMNDKDIRNVYHHLNDLCGLGYLSRSKRSEDCPKCFYELTPQAITFEQRYTKFVKILKQNYLSSIIILSLILSPFL